jgi:predicted TIM-barrel fold metal-dependent hydrolase
MNQWIDASAYWGQWSVRTPGVADRRTFLAKMDALGIEVAAITGLRALVDNTRLGNREIVEIVSQSPDRLVGVACINPMMGPAAQKEVAQCIAEGFRALRLYPAHHLYTARDRMALDPILERAAAAAGMPVYWTGCPAPGSILPQTPLDGLEDLALAFPTVPFVLSAYNYREYYRITWLMRAASNVHLEISCYHGVEGVREFTQAFGADRVLLGTGYGIQYAGIGVGKVETADIPEAARALVGRDNARRLLYIE